MKRTILAPRTLAEAEAVAAGFLAARRAKHGNMTMTGPTGEGQGDTGQGDGGDAGDGAGTGGQGDTAGQGNDLGFPANTPVAEMTDGQAAAYWRNQSKVQQARADKVKDYDQAAADATKWREHLQAQQTPSEQAVQAAREEGRAAALREANESAATAILRSSLGNRGKDEAAVGALMRGVNPAGFLKDNDVDHAAIAAFVDSIAPAQSQQQRDIGQGRGRGSTGGSSVAAGRERWNEQRSKQRTTT